jgi:hypothetical protein
VVIDVCSNIHLGAEVKQGLRHFQLFLTHGGIECCSAPCVLGIDFRLMREQDHKNGEAVSLALSDLRFRNYFQLLFKGFDRALPIRGRRRIRICAGQRQEWRPTLARHGKARAPRVEKNLPEIPLAKTSVYVSAAAKRLHNRSHVDAMTGDDQLLIDGQILSADRAGQ